MSDINPNDTLAFRVIGYYRDTVPGGNTVVTSGFLCLNDAKQLLQRFRDTGFILDPRLQFYPQGESWQDYIVDGEVIDAEFEVRP